MSASSQDDNYQDYLEQLSALNAGFLENDMRSFIEHGKSFLYYPESVELGGIAGKSLLHLQCRSGLETLSWATLGARTMGVDFDENAIQRANFLTQAKGLDARFLRADIFKLPEILLQTFDIVYTAYGVLYWLKDLQAWGQLVAHYLAPGGIFYLVDFHPTANLLDEEVDIHNPQPPQVRYPYKHLPYQHHSTKQARPPFEYRGTLVWNYALSDILNALIAAGLHITHVHEQDAMFARRFEQMEQDQQGLWRWRDPDYHIPLLFSVRATH
jgi:SAM-dependent methyltransferase